MEQATGQLARERAERNFHGFSDGWDCEFFTVAPLNDSIDEYSPHSGIGTKDSQSTQPSDRLVSLPEPGNTDARKWRAPGEQAKLIEEWIFR